MNHDSLQSIIATLYQRADELDTFAKAPWAIGTWGARIMKKRAADHRDIAGLLEGARLTAVAPCVSDHEKCPKQNPCPVKQAYDRRLEDVPFDLARHCPTLKERAKEAVAA